MAKDLEFPSVISGGRCRACGHVFAPMQSYGCENCGAHGDKLDACSLPGTGTVASAAIVYVHRQPTPPAPFGVAEVTLDAGPVIRVLTEGTARAGERVRRSADGIDGLPRFVVDAPA